MEIGVVQALRALALEPKNRKAVARDQGCLAGLVLVLDNMDKKVVFTALEALQFLSQCEENHTIMRHELGLMESLDAVIANESELPESKKLAEEVKENIREKKPVHKATHESKQPLRRSARNMASKTPHKSDTPSRGTQQSFFTGVTNKKARVVVLYVEGLKSRSAKQRVQDALLKVRGVISFTFDLGRSRVTVRARAELSAEEVGRSILSKAQLTSQQVVKDENGLDMMVPLTSDDANEGVSDVKMPETTAEPMYLDDFEASSPGNLRSAIVDTSKKGKNGEGGWFGYVGDYISRTLYW